MQSETCAHLSIYVVSASLQVYEGLHVYQCVSVERVCACVCEREQEAKCCVCLSRAAECGMSQLNSRSCQCFVFTACDGTPAAI